MTGWPLVSQRGIKVRAYYDPKITKEQFDQEAYYQIQGEDIIHHFVKVVRLRPREKVLLLNGKGLTVTTEVLRVDKLKIDLEVVGVVEKKRPYIIDYAVGITKRESFEDTMRIAVESGVHRFFPIKTEFANDLYIKDERLDKILESSLTPSNNPFMTEIREQTFLKELEFKNYKKVYYFTLSSEKGKALGTTKLEPDDSILVILGPEGGLSVQEEDYLDQNGAIGINLATPILRTPNALSCSVGYLLAHYQNN